MYAALASYVEANKSKFLTPDWKGLSILQRVRFFACFWRLSYIDWLPQAASHTAAYDINFVPTPRTASVKPKFIYLLNADEIDPKSIPQNAFVVYQGHHGDTGAQLADVCLPGAAYTEKSVTWVNTEGRPQVGRAAVPPPGASREDWKIVR